MQFSFRVKAGSANYLFSVILGDRLCHTCDPTAWFLTGCSVSHIKTGDFYSYVSMERG